MPELPEVRTAVFYISKEIIGKKIKSINIKVEKMIKNSTIHDFTNKIINKKIVSLTNRAKFLIFHFDDGTKMLSHLRMEGKYRFEKELRFNKHDHVIFGFEDGFLVFNDTRKFGTFELKNEENYLATLPLLKLAQIPSKSNAIYIFEKLKKKKTAIKNALLDQTIIAGLGNIYADEVLNMAQIDPRIPSFRISCKDIKNILKCATKIMDDATKKGGSSIRSYLSFNKIKGSYQKQLRAHMQLGKRCKNIKCPGIIEKIKIGGRGTYICNVCQNKQNKAQ